MLSQFPASGPSLLEDPLLSNALLHAEEGEALEVHAKAASALAIGLAQRLYFLSKQYGASADTARLSACVATMVCEAVLQGHICMPLHSCASRLGLDFNTLRTVLLRSGVVCQETDISHTLLPILLDTSDQLYLARYYDYEQRLAQGLSTLLYSPLPAKQPERAIPNRSMVGTMSAQTLLTWQARVNRHSDALGLAEHQRLAVALTVLNRLTLISGGPGTGKTTTTLGLLACLLDGYPTLRIALAAPTGRAAQHLFHALTGQAVRLPITLAERLPQKAFTVHRLLSERGQEANTQATSINNDPALSQNYTQATRQDRLPYDLIVIDEASMLDVVLATQLIEALPADARLVLLGDKYQLGAIEAGAVFASLTASSRFTSHYLDQLALLLPQNPILIDSLRLQSAYSDRPQNQSEATPSISTPVSAAMAGQLAFNFEPTICIEETTASSALGSSSTGPSQDIQDAHTTPASPIHALVNCCVKLERNYRFAKDSPIGCLAQAIREVNVQAALAVLTRVMPGSPGVQENIQGEEGEAPESVLLIDEDQQSDIRHVEYSLSEAALARLAEGFTPYFDALQTVLFQSIKTDPFITPLSDTNLHAPFKALSNALNAYRVLCPVYQGPYGVSTLNRRLEQLFRTKLLGALYQQQASTMNPYLQQIALSLQSNTPTSFGQAEPHFAWYPGLPLIIMRNDYSLDLFNGDIGIVLPRQTLRQALPATDFGEMEGAENALLVLFYKPDGSVRIILPALLPPWKAAFAMTVHKAQGSEFDHVALVLPRLSKDSKRYPTTRAILYTAITRARRRVTLLGSTQALEAAIQMSTPLHSGLQTRLEALVEKKRK